MINIAFTVLSLVVLSVAIFTRDHSIFPKNNSSTVLATETEVEATSTPEVEPSPTETPTPTPEPTVTPTLAPTVTPTAVPVPAQPVSFLLSWRYPDSSVISQTDTSLTLSSNTDPKVIVNWYKDRIKSENFHATSMIQTSTNGKILDKIVAADGTREVRIEINRDAGSNTAGITVDLKVNSSSI